MGIESIVEKLITPKLEEFAEWCKDKYNEYLIPTAEHFQEYLERSYNKYSIINTLVFHNSQRLLEEIYVAQTLVKEHPSKDKEESTKIDRLPVSLIKKYKRILITDTAGMGKSTMMKRMFLDLIDRGLEDVGIPIYIELNRLNKDRTILKEIQEGLSSLSEVFDNDLLLSFIQKGGFIFFLDGYDEISIADRDKVTQDIKDFISKASTGNYFILTSRPEGNLSSFGEFQLFTIQPLTKDEAFELLRKYDLSNKKELSENLVRLLQSGEYDSIDEFLENPLLVSLLFTAYDFNRSIPLEKHRFYGVVFEAYFEKHDNTKAMKKREKHSGLNYDGFDSILRYIGYACLIRTGVKFNKDTILNTIRKAKDFCGIADFSENAFLEDLVSTVPLFCKERTDYKWVHKSLLEYFAARFIFCDAKEDQDRILTAIYNSEHIDKYINMLDLYYDIDLKGFSKNITLPFCENFIENCDSHFNDINLSKDLIHARISNLLFAKSALWVVSVEGRRTTSQAWDMIEETNPEFQLDYYPYEIQHVHNKEVFFAKGKLSKIYSLARLLKEKKAPVVLHEKERDYEDFFLLRDEGFPKEMNEFEHEKICVIDVKTGFQSKELYHAIDVALLCSYGYGLGFRIDYEACKKEAERIKKEIDRSKTADLISGI